MSENKLMDIIDLSVSYGPIQALNGVSYLLIKGKSSHCLVRTVPVKQLLLQTVSGLLKPTNGKLSIKGLTLLEWKQKKLLKNILIHVPEHRQVFSTMTVLDNLYLGAYHHRKKTKRKILKKILKGFSSYSQY